MELTIKEKAVNNIILEEYAKKYKPEELTPDGIPNTETQLREIEEEEKKQLSKYNEKERYKKDMIMRVKCLSLHKMGLSPLTNTFEMRIKDREKLQEIMYSYNDKDHKDIIEEFNEVIGDLLDEKNDYSNIPIYNC